MSSESEVCYCPRCDEECDEDEMLESYDAYHNRVAVCPDCDGENIHCEMCYEYFDPEYVTTYPEDWSEELWNRDEHGFLCSECAENDIEYIKELAEEQKQICVEKEQSKKRWQSAILIQRAFRKARYDPKYKMCKAVLFRGLERDHALPAGTADSVWK